MKQRAPIKVRIVRNRLLRKRVYDRDGGMCVRGCGFDPKWEADHILDLAFGGKDVLENMQTLCRRHHGRKTSAAAPVRAKTDRLAARDQLSKERRAIR